MSADRIKKFDFIHDIFASIPLSMRLVDVNSMASLIIAESWQIYHFNTLSCHVVA
jgi:hypothetical protein